MTENHDRIHRPTAALEMPHTKVVGTLGPGSDHCIGELLSAGLSVARINLSHGTHDEHRRRVEAIRREARVRRRAVGILADIQGPKLRLANFQNGGIEVDEGETYRLAEGTGVSKEGEILFNLESFQISVDLGHRIYLNDGVVELEVIERKKGYSIGRVVRGGRVGDKKGVHLPDSQLLVDLPTKKDRADLELCRELGVDMIGVSFVGGAEDLRAVRELAPKAVMIAKIERQAALDNLDEILAETDGIMIARGDLGVEVPLEQLPLVQKSLIQSALRTGRFVITATEMLESMVKTSRPTRAEVADVANAVLDGTDALMLSAETAMGEYPVEAVKTMVRIAGAVEQSQLYNDLPRVAFRGSEPNFANATALAAAQAAEALNLSKIICFTETGNTVRLISRYRPAAQIIGLTPHEATLNAMTVLAHVRPVLVPRERSVEDLLSRASQMLLGRGMVQLGEEVVFVAGVPPGESKSTNLMKLHRIGEKIKLS